MTHKNVVVANQTLDDSAPRKPRQTRGKPHVSFLSVIQVRKLVAVELTFLGPKIVIAEYAVAVVVGLLVAVLSLRSGLYRTHAMWQTLLGFYLLFIVLAYAVLLASAIGMARRGDCRNEIVDELNNTREVFRKYRRQSLWILVPLAVPLAALRQHLNRYH